MRAFEVAAQIIVYGISIPGLALSGLFGVVLLSALSYGGWKTGKR
jgi:hypothetical protein